jgi:hypothetical protein
MCRTLFCKAIHNGDRIENLQCKDLGNSEVLLLPSVDKSRWIYLRLLRSRFVSTGTRRQAMRAGVRLVEIADNNMKTALTTCLLKLDIPVSFLIDPDIHGTGNQCRSPNTGKANMIIYKLKRQKTVNTMSFDKYQIRVFEPKHKNKMLILSGERISIF